MREIINKPVSTEQLLETARDDLLAAAGTTIKLYFMIGHPSETLEDVQAIADLCKAVLAEGRKVIGRRAQVTAGVSTFIPKPHTPFQWVPCDTIEQIRAKQDAAEAQPARPGLKLNWNSPEDTMLEAWLSRGDRRMAEVIYQAWQRGAKFDAWKEHFRYDLWLEAFAACGLDPAFLHPPRAPDRRDLPLGAHQHRRAQEVPDRGLPVEPARQDPRRLPRALFRLRHPAHLCRSAPHEPGRSLAVPGSQEQAHPGEQFIPLQVA